MPDDQHPDKNKPQPHGPSKSIAGSLHSRRSTLQHNQIPAVAKTQQRTSDASKPIPPKPPPVIQKPPVVVPNAPPRPPSKIDIPKKEESLVQKVRSVFPLMGSGADVPDALNITAPSDSRSERPAAVTFAPLPPGSAGVGRTMPPFPFREVTPSGTAKAKFRRVAAVLALTRRHEDMQQISPQIRAVVEDKTKTDKQADMDPSTGLPFILGPRHQTKSLFSVHSNETPLPDISSIKTNALDNNNNTAYVVSDPMEKHYLIESTTNRLYSYFLGILAVSALFSSLCTYSLQHIPPIFAKKVFFQFFWFSLSNIFLIVLTLLAWSVLGSMFLVCPTQKDWPRSIRKVRWFILAVPILLMHVCHLGWDINLTRLDDEYHPDLVKRMVHNLRSTDNATLLLSQSYFQCCGVYNYTDWDNDASSMYHGGYPPTCCSEKVDPNGCTVPIRSHARNGQLQVWPKGCLHFEREMVNSVVMLVFILLTAILISMYVALYYLITAINIVLKHEIIVHLPF